MLLAAVCLLTSCEETLFAEYQVFNYTSENVTICYTEQLKPAQDDTQRRQYAKTDSVVVLSPGTNRIWKYDLGKFPSSQKLTEEYDINGMGLTPLYDRIKYIAVGWDTLSPETYNNIDLWAFENDGKNAVYKLFISK